MELAVVTSGIRLNTSREGQMVDITERVQERVTSSGLLSGIVTLFMTGSTAALTTIEYEPGLLKDFPGMLERVAPRRIDYEHEKMWHDGNGHSHVRAALIGPSLAIPFVEGKLTLGTWQQIVLVELDIRGRSRSIIVQILGE